MNVLQTLPNVPVCVALTPIFGRLYLAWNFSDLCLEPSVDVSRLAALVRAEGPGPASGDDDGLDVSGGATKFRFQARHYRILETLALPGVEDAPVREFSTRRLY